MTTIEFIKENRNGKTIYSTEINGVYVSGSFCENKKFAYTYFLIICNAVNVYGRIKTPKETIEKTIINK